MQDPRFSRQDWLDKVRKERKGGDPADMTWVLSPELSFGPHPAAGIRRWPLRVNVGWQIGAYVRAGSPEQTNKEALEELQGGAEALLFSFHHQPDVQEIGRQLTGIQPEFISLHANLFFPDPDPAILFRDLVYYLRKSGYDLSKVKGSVDFDPLLDWGEPPWDPLLRLMDFVREYMPGFRVLQVNGRDFNTGPEYTAEELALIIAKGAEYLHQLKSRGVDPALANRHLQFAVTQGTQYFLEIAKLRALRLLWANVLLAFDVEPEPTTLAAHTDPAAFDDDQHQNLLRITSQGMAAVVGGADLVFLRPPDASPSGLDGATDFGRRMARNVQQLLRLESGFDQLRDPAAGSYYLDQMTDQLTQLAWQRFCQIEADGGFSQLKNL